MEALLAGNDSVNWSDVSTLPPSREPQAGTFPLPPHSPRIRRATSGEDRYGGWASTEAAADLGIPVVLPEALQVVAPWFISPTPTGAGRHGPEWDSTGGGRETSRRGGEFRRASGGNAPMGFSSPLRSYRAPYWVPLAPAVTVVAPSAAEVASYASVMAHGRPCLWYEKVDVLITRELREGLSIGWRDIPPGAALVGDALCFGGAPDRIQVALESLEAGRSTLVQLCTVVTQAVDRREIADW